MWFNGLKCSILSYNNAAILSMYCYAKTWVLLYIVNENWLLPKRNPTPIMFLLVYIALGTSSWQYKQKDWLFTDRYWSWKYTWVYTTLVVKDMNETVKKNFYWETPFTFEKLKSINNIKNINYHALFVLFTIFNMKDIHHFLFLILCVYNIISTLYLRKPFISKGIIIITRCIQHSQVIFNVA